MNVCRSALYGSVRWCAVLPLVVMLFGAPGCEFGGGAPPPEGILAIENVAKWYQLYRASHRGKPPKDEDAFIEFIEKDLAARGSEILDREQFLTSPRDGQKYIIQYGKANSKNIERNVAVYEQEGYRDKKLLAFEAAWSKEVDDAELQSLLAEK